MKVIVIGDYLVDRYLIGEASRLSAEAPIPIIKVLETFDLPGGAGNVAANLESLGVEVILAVGTGPIKSRLMVGDTQIARWDISDTCGQAALPPYIRDIDAIVVADYAKGSVDPQSLLDLRFVYPSLPVFIDTKRNPSRYWSHNVTFFPNLSEYRQFPTYNYLFPATVVVKRGSEGAEIIDGPRVAGWDVGVRCVNGAGDSFMASYVAGVLRGVNNPLEYANAAAAISVTKPYTSVVSDEEIQLFLSERSY